MRACLALAPMIMLAVPVAGQEMRFANAHDGYAEPVLPFDEDVDDAVPNDSLAEDQRAIGTPFVG